MHGDSSDQSRRWFAADPGSRFTELFHRFWDSTITADVTSAETMFIEHALQLPSAARLLVLPSGCGRIALGLAERKHFVLGIDRCADAVERACLLARRARVPATFQRWSDQLASPPHLRYDGAVCVGHCFDEHMLRAAATHLAAGLAPGKRALIELPASRDLAIAELQPISSFADLQGRPWNSTGGQRFLLCERT